MRHNTQYRSKLQKMSFVVPSWDDRGFFTQVTLSERYVVDVLGISPRILIESGMSSAVNKMILKEHLLMEGWWDAVKQKAGDALKGVKSIGEVFQKFGENVKGVATGLYYLTTTPDGVPKTIDAAEDMKLDALQYCNNTLEKVIEIAKEGYEAAGGSTGQEGQGEEDELSTYEKFVAWIRKKYEQIEEWLVNLGSGEGWKAMLSGVMGTLFAVYVKDTIEETVSSIKKIANEGLPSLIEYIKKKLFDVSTLGKSAATAFTIAGISAASGIGPFIVAAVSLFKKYKKVDWVIGNLKKILSKVNPAAPAAS